MKTLSSKCPAVTSNPREQTSNRSAQTSNPTSAPLNALRVSVPAESSAELMSGVPRHWRVQRLKFLAHIQTGLAKGKDHGELETIEVPYLRVANVQDGYLALDDMATMEVPVGDLSRYLLRPGDVLMNEGGDFDKLGRGHVWQGEIEPCIHQNHVFAVRPHGVRPEWLSAYTGSAAAQFYFMSRSKQSTNLASISSSNLMELPIPVPPDEEQAVLLAAMARETARIDALIEKKTRFIELLREKRQALTTQAVTQGLDPKVPMKDSGVEWLGQVPAHWKTTRIRYVAKLESGHTPDKQNPDYWTNCDIPWISLSDSEQLRRVDYVSDTSKMINADGLANSSARLLPQGTVVMTRDATVGLSAITATTMAVSQHLVAWVPGKDVASEYLLRVVRAMEPWLHQLSTGTTIATIGMDAIKSLVMPLPPLQEQQEIAHAVQSRSESLTALLNKTQRSVELLKERRAALITAAVTGQIDLRDAA